MLWRSLNLKITISIALIVTTGCGDDDGGEEPGDDGHDDSLPYQAMYETTRQVDSDEGCDDADTSEMEEHAFEDYFRLVTQAGPGDQLFYTLDECTSPSEEDCSPTWGTYGAPIDDDHQYIDEGLVSESYGFFNNSQTGDECTLSHIASRLEATGDGSVRVSYVNEEVTYDVNEHDFECDDYMDTELDEESDLPDVIEDAECTDIEFLLEGERLN